MYVLADVGPDDCGECVVHVLLLDDVEHVLDRHQHPDFRPELRHHASSRLSRLSEDALDTLRKLLRRWRDELEALLGNGKLLTCLTDEVAPTGATGWQVTTEPVPEAALGG